MGLKSITSKIESFLVSTGRGTMKTDNGCYRFELPECQLSIYPEVFIARIEVKPTTKKYHLHANKRLQTDFGTMYVDNNPNLSNPTLVFGIVEDQLNNQNLADIINYMVSNIDSIFS